MIPGFFGSVFLYIGNDAIIILQNANQVVSLRARHRAPLPLCMAGASGLIYKT